MEMRYCRTCKKYVTASHTYSGKFAGHSVGNIIQHGTSRRR